MSRQIIESAAQELRAGSISSDRFIEGIRGLLARRPELLPLVRHTVSDLAGEGLLAQLAVDNLLTGIAAPGGATEVQHPGSGADGKDTWIAAPATGTSPVVDADATVASDKTVVREREATRVRPPIRTDATRKPDQTASPSAAASGSSQHGAQASVSGSDWSDPSAWRPTLDGPIGPGSVIKDRYVVEALLGEGGMGAVYKVRDLVHEAASDRDPHVAMKVLSEGFRRHPDSLKALHRETRKTQTLAHPNIITVYHFDHDGTTVFMTMELLDGKPLDEVVSACALTGLPEAEAGAIVDQMAAGLAYAHERGFVHADFKPGNVFYCSDGRVKLLDFGIARPARIAGGDDTDKTQFDVHSLGAMTPGYASVEMLNGEHPEPADDVYALGCVAYQLYCGRHPFDRERATVAREEQRKPAPLKGLSRRRRRAIERALRFDRHERFADAGEFLKAFRPPRPLQRWAAAALLLLTSVSGLLGVRQIWFSDTAVEFSELEPGVQQQVRALEGPAEEAFALAASMQEYRNEALDYYLRILNKHPDNETANERVAVLAGQWSEDARRMTASGDAAGARRLIKGLLASYPQLARDEEFSAVARQLKVTLP